MFYYTKVVECKKSTYIWYHHNCKKLVDKHMVKAIKINPKKQWRNSCLFHILKSLTRDTLGKLCGIFMTLFWMGICAVVQTVNCGVVFIYNGLKSIMRKKKKGHIHVR